MAPALSWAAATGRPHVLCHTEERERGGSPGLAVGGSTREGLRRGCSEAPDVCTWGGEMGSARAASIRTPGHEQEVPASRGMNLHPSETKRRKEAPSARPPLFWNRARHGAPGPGFYRQRPHTTEGRSQGPRAGFHPSTQAPPDACFSSKTGLKDQIQLS